MLPTFLTPLSPLSPSAYRLFVCVCFFSRLWDLKWRRTPGTLLSLKEEPASLYSVVWGQSSSITLINSDLMLHWRNLDLIKCVFISLEYHLWQSWSPCSSHTYMLTLYANCGVFKAVIRPRLRLSGWMARVNTGAGGGVEEEQQTAPRGQWRWSSYERTTEEEGAAMSEKWRWIMSRSIYEWTVVVKHPQSYCEGWFALRLQFDCEGGRIAKEGHNSWKRSRRQ